MLIALLLVVAPCALAEAEDMATTDALLSMQPVFDSILRTVMEDASSYDPANAAFVCGVLYRMGVNYGLDYPGTSIDEATFDIMVPGALMRSFAASAFPGLSGLSAPTVEGMSYDEEKDLYRLPGSDMGETESVVEGYQEQDGQLTVTAAMKDFEGNKLDGMTFVVSPAQGEALFPYVINSAE